MKWLELILTYFPVVLQAVIAVETAIKDAPGATKKAVVMTVIQAGDATQMISDAHATDLGKLIDVTKAALNAVKPIPEVKAQ